MGPPTLATILLLGPGIVFVAQALGSHAPEEQVFEATLSPSISSQEYFIEIGVDVWVAAELTVYGSLNADLELVDPEGFVVAASTRAGSSFEAVGFLVDRAGVWTVKVRGVGGTEGPFKLIIARMKAPVLSSPDPTRQIVAILDTGISQHPEIPFGEILAWRDFAGDRRGNLRSVPYDDHGHGTGVASLSAGIRDGPIVRPQLVIAKVLNYRGEGEWGQVGTALQWAMQFSPNIILLSLGSNTPLSGVQAERESGIYEILREARAAGALVVTANGNGQGVAGELHAVASSPDVLAVGSATHDGRPSAANDLDPELLAWGEMACVARAAGIATPSPWAGCAGGDRRYGVVTGSSFAAARVSAFGVDLGGGSPGDRECALKAAAVDRPDIPYTVEGNGFIPASPSAGIGDHVLYCGSSVPNAWQNRASDVVKWAIARSTP